ncbi:HNH endonuclease signature motif containing protein [Allokutzneria multivorans]|uniref:HNH endonuclease signature motif containing protein n=1 Tax=Allokutzneria multivorans TaxID=1142134 RepID=A0ABP7QSQ8_9PSEU
MEITDFIDHLTGFQPYQLPEEEILPMVRELETVQRMVVAVMADLAAEAETRSLHVVHGCRSLAVLLRDTLVLSPYEARRRARLVKELPSLPETARALREGDIQAEHVFVIADTLRALPVEHRDDAERELAKHARTLNHKELEKAGKYVRALLDPDGVFAEEQDSIAKRGLKAHQDANGNTVIRGVLDPEAGEAFMTAMQSLATPRKDDDRTPEQRNADALVELVRVAMASQALPMQGGERPQVIITISYQALLAGLSVGWTSWSGPLSAQLVRKIACDSTAIPIVLDGNGIPLDYGREKRTAPKALRKALAVRDKGCAFPGCDRPPAWTEAHHVVHWINGGETSLGNMVLLCSHHHHVIHQQEWEIVFEAGLPVFLPPAWIDPAREPRRNIRLAAAL